MLSSFLASAVLFCAFQSAMTQTMTSLYVPGFTSQPISADVLGVDGEGQTTWVLKGGPSRTAGGKVGFAGTATLVEGPNFASITYVDPSGTLTIDKSCSLSAGLAFCATSTGSESAIAVETPVFIPVQAGTTIVAFKENVTTLPAPLPTATSTSLTGESPPARTSSSQRQDSLSYFGVALCIWLIVAQALLI